MSVLNRRVLADFLTVTELARLHRVAVVFKQLRAR